ncbi:Protein transport protein sec1 [Apiospora aurea]|uniref:Protein transport protein sec1 n=1 Tax=Apiospora aurea TaxID=335848 RepID=A0ABR1QJR5_9PEZI
MGVSVMHEQREIIIDTIKNITQNDWKVLVIDEHSKKILDSVVKEDDILSQNIANIERIEERRERNPTMDAIYILTPEQYIVDCLIADLEARRYQKSFLVWTAAEADKWLAFGPTADRGFETLSIDFFPRESHLVTFKDPWSFPVLYHPACNGLVAKHMRDLAQKIAGVCITLGEYPKVRYYRPKAPLHEASVLSAHLARFVSDELDEYAQWNPNFPPPSSRPQGILLVTDRSMDIMAPLVHEFTYQAMAHDLLPIQEGDKTTFHMTVNEGEPDAEEKDMELNDNDKVWVDNRHRHMKDTIDKLMGDFQKFLDQNAAFTDANADTTNLNTIKDMLAGLPQFQEMKEIYSLHLTMAQECMNIFASRKLPDIASSEQTMATGLDEDYRKPKEVLQAVVRLLDDDAITASDRLRLVIIRRGARGYQATSCTRIPPPQDTEVVANLELLGARTTIALKDPKRDTTPLFPIDVKSMVPNEEYALSRFQPVLKALLENLCRGALDQTAFPYVKPPLDPNEDMIVGQGSLRAAKPSWAGAGRRVPENRQRIIVFMAGGATFSESRICYEVGNSLNRDVILTTSHMLTPQLFIRQVGDLSVDKRRLDLPMDRPPRRAPAHLFERPPPPQMAAPPPPGAPGRPPGAGQGLPARRPMPPGGGGGLPGAPRAAAPPTQAMSSMNLGPAAPGRSSPANGSPTPPPSSDKPHKMEKEKKKRNLFGIKKSH